MPDLADDAWRVALSDAAVEATINLVDVWRLTSRQAAALLGEASDEAWFRLRAGKQVGALSQATLTRISALVGLYKGLHLLFSEPLANEWVRRSNDEVLFGGATPLDFMIAGGVDAMIRTRAYIDALRGGL